MRLGLGVLSGHDAGYVFALGMCQHCTEEGGRGNLEGKGRVIGCKRGHRELPGRRQGKDLVEGLKGQKNRR